MTGDSRSDGELLADLPRQPEVMGVLYERHARAVFRYLARRAGPPAAEDLLSEVFIIALSASARVVAHDSGSALPWLYGIALNVLRAYFRRQPPATGMAPDLGMDWDAVDERLDAFAERGRLRAALDGLADSDRELLLLVAWEGLTPAEAAAALGTNLGASATEADRKPTRWLSSLREGAHRHGGGDGRRGSRRHRDRHAVIPGGLGGLVRQADGDRHPDGRDRAGPGGAGGRVSARLAERPVLVQRGQVHMRRPVLHGPGLDFPLR
jgi:RNA polymerase sigma-70 factor (ECF subfamily)